MQLYIILFQSIFFIISSSGSPISQFSQFHRPSQSSPSSSSQLFIPYFNWRYDSPSSDPRSFLPPPPAQGRNSFFDLPLASHFLSDSSDNIDVSVDDLTLTNQTMNRCNCACGQVDRKQRIVGGNITKLHEFPWIAALSKKGRFYCGGTLIGKRHILTAAHCIEGVIPKDIKVTLGEHDRLSKNESVPVLVRRIKKATQHPDFSLSTFNNDIAILEMDSGVNFDAPQIHPACLPENNDKDYTGNYGIVAGWGRIEERKPTAATLRKVEVPILSEEDCKNAGYSQHRITKNMMCAGYSEGKRDSCQGDSGGPLQIPSPRPGKMEVIGIVSWGRGCARPNYPGVYTRVANYLSWIHSQLGDDCTCNL